ncbi:hypothetical protein DSCW_50930 [Desulfosarcina widdelii]|uniref:Uncharacterized protein n=1 Tax=Desulfosarcina widdelii TaxID=947919 RepID=A0A5K7Z786_9BACT|nr:hypothetical protein DSCW_50930 [Desulfosarcina widdelii]
MKLNYRNRLVFAIACLAAVLILAGCGGGGDGDVSSASSPTYPAPAVVYADAFPDDAAFNAHWATEDPTGGNASWAVVGGELSQTGHLEDNDLRDLTFDGLSSYHLGTYAYLVDPSISGSYRFSVSVLPKDNNAVDKTEGNDVGILFGYEDDDNYYRISMNARYGFTRFEKRSGGNFETIAVNARGYVDENWVSMAAEISGDTIVVWINGQPIFAWVDSAVLSGTVALYCQDRCRFDNVRITENPRQPTVAIASPLAYSVTPNNSFQAKAVVLSKPSGSSVAFSLDDGSEISATASGGYYLANFNGVADGEHEVTAVLRYADGTRADIDVNATVGTGGDYYVSVGDSITNGKYDEDPSNNDSADGRIVSIQGYQAPLVDALGTQTRPVIVFNEGIAGEDSTEMETRIVSILERHPGANQVLMLIGTNDSYGGGLPSATFADNVDDTADLIVDAGKQVWLAEILPTRDDDARNATIQQYNVEIQTIAGTVADVFLGPDLYTNFNSPSYYTDNLHPNDTGYGVIADQWYDKLH